MSAILSRAVAWHHEPCVFLCGRQAAAALLIACVCIIAFTCIGSADELEQLRYNHPGLIVDLGVGLWAWPIPCDADDDGDFDLIVSCPDKPSNGVWLFENATGDTSDNKMPVFKPARLLSKTVRYVMPSYVDGAMRVLSPDAEYVDFIKSGTSEVRMLAVNPKFEKPLGNQTKGLKIRHNQWRYVDYDGDGSLDLIVGIEDWSDYGWDNAWDSRGKWQNGPLHGWIYLLRNRGTTDRPDYAEPIFVGVDGHPIEVYGCPSPNFGDFDGDGDLDLICGEFLDSFTYFENTGSRTSPRYSAGKRIKTDQGNPLAMDLQMIVPVAFDWDRDGDLDLIVGDEDGRVALIENVTRKGSVENIPSFASPRYFQQEAETLKCGALATPVGFDWDGDGDMDILSGNTSGVIEYFENMSGPSVASPKWNRPVAIQVDGKDFRMMAGSNGSIQGPAEAKWGYTTLNIGDWDGDGLPDIILNSILGRVVWLRNVGTRQNPSLDPPRGIEVEWSGEQPRLAWGWLQPSGNELLTQWRTTPVVFDFNADGLMDIAMLDHEGYLAYFERARIEGKMILKAPRRAFVDEAGLPIQLNAGAAGKSGRRKLCVADWDGDGKLDFLLNSVNADFLKQVGFRDGKWTMKNIGSLAKRNIEGHDVSPSIVDFNGDRIPDFLGGAEDGRLYFMKSPRSH